MTTRIDREPISVVLRISGATLLQKPLEEAISCDLERFDNGNMEKPSYAQLNIPLQAGLWPSIADILARIGHNLAALIDTGLISKVDLDLAFPFYDTDFAISQSIPNDIVEALGRSRVGITVSFYPTSDSDGNGAGTSSAA